MTTHLATNPRSTDHVRLFAADQPVHKRSEDRLGRTAFAEAIANAIVSWNQPESLVMAVTGAWGSGKTSIKNFVVDALGDIPQPKAPDILEFSPWQITGRDQIAEAFFRDVALKLGRRDRKGINKRIEQRWRRWAAALKLTSSLNSLIPKQLTITGFISSLIILGLTRVPSLVNDSWLFWIGISLAIVSSILSTSATAAEAVANAFGTFSKSAERTLDELRSELRDGLAKRQQSLVIVIDDIDRLPAPDIKLIFQLVKAVSDFPRLTFLLLFERQTVERAVVDVGHTTGGEYLEKIIQIPFMVPTIDSACVREIFVEEVNYILEMLPSTVQLDERRWWNMFVGGIDAYIVDLRDIYRFMNGYKFHSGLLSSNQTVEVNPIDLIGVEALRIFEPDLYNELPNTTTRI